MESDNPEFYKLPYCGASLEKKFRNTLSPIEKRLDVFYELQTNEWFGVMNWVLGQLVLKDPTDRRRHLWGHCFYFDAKKLRRPVYDYKNMW